MTDQAYADKQQSLLDALQALAVSLTRSRRALIRGLVEQAHACDAVTLMQAARRHHPATSLGSTYRFLRLLEQHQLAMV
ncbi:hypothetical protein [Oleiagrimonas sp. C23AA]|uniref:hypothetical protein n=1 Tax=Oleiagrimonas sp. C23AA TaxID=2719047 RepID=UPI00141FC32C|nr:hypothetical protein [Oleiagrimonas sp. C23AA]NII09297.1 hypothetical protein [Oleiagrimonas sp. C23AA]